MTTTPTPRADPINVNLMTLGRCRHSSANCQHTVCRYHMANLGPGDHVPKFPGGMLEACALDSAELGPLSLLDISLRIGVSRERVRQIEAKALAKIGKKHPDLLEMFAELVSHRGGPVYPETLNKDDMPARKLGRKYASKCPTRW
jgi:hypothetical protein